MKTQKLAIVGVALASVLFLAIQGIPNSSPTPVVRELSPVQALSGGRSRAVATGWSGCGWSIEPDTTRAAGEALSQAQMDGESGPDLTLAFYNPTHDPVELADALRANGARRILGETTHEGILTPDGYQVSKDGVIGVLASSLEHVQVGVGGASFDEATPEEATQLAWQRAIADAGLDDSSRKPSMVLLCVTLPNEEVVLATLETLTGPDVPLIGGTAAGTVDAIQRKKISNWSIIANERVIESGLGIALLYSDEDFAWSYGGGYRRTRNSGIATKVTGRLIHEIDGKPAADIYDEWLGGGVTRARERGDDIVNYCTLYPLARNHSEDRNQFIRAWPADDPQNPGSLRTGSSVQEGDEVFLGEGDWNMLLNHFATVPGAARQSFPEQDPTAGLFVYCGGALACIPREERPQMAFLVSNTLGDLPWIGVFTWGEQGNLPGVGNLHANLSSGTVLFPPATTNE